MSTQDEELERLLRFLYLCPVGLAELDNGGEIAMLNSAGVRLLMPVDPQSELTNLFDVLSTVAPELREIARSGSEQEGTLCEGHRIEVRGEAPATLAATLVRIDPARIMAVVQDVTRTVEQERLLHADRERFRAIYEGVRDSMICTLDVAGTIDGWNSSGERLFGHSGEELYGKPLTTLAIDPNAEVEHARALARARSHGWCETGGWHRRQDGTQFWGDGLISALRDERGDIMGFAVVLRDVTDRRLALERLQELAIRDPLTGLSNRRHFYEQAERDILLAQRHGTSLALLMIDADHFKRINDSYGHPVGDEVLRQLARTLKEQLRATDLAARYGGEELIVLLPATNAEGAMLLAERIRLAVAACAIEVTGGPVRCTVSIGIAAIKRDDAGLEALIARADAALYAAKKAGRNRCCVDTISPEPSPPQE